LPETDILTFGYYGTGSNCYREFLTEMGFKDPGVGEVRTPSKLTADGKWINGHHKYAKWQVQVEGKTLEEARGNLQPIDTLTTCIIQEEILCDGNQTELKEVVQALNDDDAVDILERNRIPKGSTIVSYTVQEKKIDSTEEIQAETDQEALTFAQNRIKTQEAPYKTLIEVSCLQKPRKGFMGLAKKPGSFLAKYCTNNREVNLVYNPMVKVQVTYGPIKIKCKRCGSIMVTTTEGVNYVNSSPSKDTEILKLRCETCDITRFEKCWEIEGHWIEWEDGSPPTII
jgi:hypothetical protein